MMIKNFHKRYWTWLCLGIILLVIAHIRLQLLSLPLDRDEGEYAYTAQIMRQGLVPYKDVYSMKWPGIYFFYYVIFGIWGETTEAIRAGLTLINLSSILLIFLIGRRLFNPAAALCAALFWATLTIHYDMDGVRANAEHFVLLPLLGGIYVFMVALEKLKLKMFFLTGTLFGLSVLTKQHALFFVPFALTAIVLNVYKNNFYSLKTFLKIGGIFCGGLMLPFILTLAYIFSQNALGPFIFNTLTYAKYYVQQVSPANAWTNFYATASMLSKTHWPVLMFLPLGLIALFFPQHKNNRHFLVIFIFFSLLSICPGFYFRSHYFLLLTPAAALLAAAGYMLFKQCFDTMANPFVRNTLSLFCILACCAFPIGLQYSDLFMQTSATTAGQYYAHDTNVKIARYLHDHSFPQDKIAILGSEPAIYFYANRRAATGFIYMYPLMEYHPLALSMQKKMIEEITQADPLYIVDVRIRSSWLASKDSQQYVFEWLKNQYRNARQVAIAEMCQGDNFTFAWRWGNSALDYQPTCDSRITILKKK